MLYYRLYKRLKAHFPGSRHGQGVSPPFCYMLFTAIIPLIVSAIVILLLDRYWSPSNGMQALGSFALITAANAYIILCEKYDKDP
jgi:hypothetical protein